MEVALVRWPAEAARRRQLAAERIPRLLLVEHGAVPPPTDGCLEDWIRVPADEQDVRLRVQAVGARAASHRPGAPHLDGDGVLHVGASWVPLPPVEARLTGALLSRFGAVVSREMLSRSGWPEGAPGRNALDVHVLRLRRRLETVGLAIRTVRSRGYVLEACAASEAG
ncbi:MAG TPA: winged helix-turn-helix domain-containing protein [Acidimicrobiales bacterium]|nr:winged helix-turn-helix domain-containing protein [Acidimicrobiales bacterium]